MTTTESLAKVLGRLGVGQTLRLRRSGPGGTVEVVARQDGSLEVPAAVLGPEDAGSHVLFARHRTAELAALLAVAVEDLELVTSSILDAAGVERLLDGSGARADVVDGVLDRWDLPMIEQVRRYLADRYAVALSDLPLTHRGQLFIGLGRLPVVIDVLERPRRVRVMATVIHSIEGSEALDLALHRLDGGDGLVRLRHHRDRVLAVVVLPAPTFMGQHIEAALDAIREVDRPSFPDTADTIVSEFGGEAWFRKRYTPQASHVVDPEIDPESDTDTDTDTEEDHP